MVKSSALVSRIMCIRKKKKEKRATATGKTIEYTSGTVNNNGSLLGNRESWDFF